MKQENASLTLMHAATGATFSPCCRWDTYTAH